MTQTNGVAAIGAQHIHSLSVLLANVVAQWHCDIMQKPLIAELWPCTYMHCIILIQSYSNIVCVRMWCASERSFYNPTYYDILRYHAGLIVHTCLYYIILWVQQTLLWSSPSLQSTCNWWNIVSGQCAIAGLVGPAWQWAPRCKPPTKTSHVHWVLLQASVLSEPTARSRPRVCVSCSFCSPFSIMLTHTTLWVVLIDSVYGVFWVHCLLLHINVFCLPVSCHWSGAPNGGATVQWCTTQSSQHTLWCILYVAALTIATLLCTNVKWVMCTVHMYTKHPHNICMWDQYNILLPRSKQADMWLHIIWPAIND